MTKEERVGMRRAAAAILSDFLDLFHFIYPNLGDTFAYASADTESIYLDGESNQAMLIEVWCLFGHSGIVAYVAKMRKAEPLRELQTEEYNQAMEYLAGWTYDPG